MTYLHVFGIDPADGAQPNGPLLLASDGNFYGTTRAGGAGRCFGVDNFCGVIFKITPGGSETVLYRFGGVPSSDGGTPTGPLIQGKDGALYGMTTSGGAFNFGTLFRITLGGDYKLLHSFGASRLDGDRPKGGLVEGTDGNFYGTTIGGGPYDCPQSAGDCGTVFRVSPAGKHTVLHSFGGTAGDGAVPNGSLIQGADGNFYGTTSLGGDPSCSPLPKINGCGTVFRMTPAGVVSILHAFGKTSADGILPQGPLTPGGDGAFYGTTSLGGGIGGCSSTPGCGTVFRITSTGSVSILYAFARPKSDGTPTPADGYNPGPILLRARDGNFYGVTESVTLAPTARTGTIFRLTPTGLKTTLHTFGAIDEVPTEPIGGLIEGPDGAFYGLTADNGKLGSVGPRSGAGTVFKVVVR